MLSLRTILFGGIQALFVFLFNLSWKESIDWWPISAIITNIIIFTMLWLLVKKEGKTYGDLIHYDKKELKQDLKRTIGVFIVGGGIGFIGFYIVSYLIYGSFILPDNMVQPFPFWIAIIGIIFFPLTNALVETPTYIGYCLPRLEYGFKSTWKALILAAFFLALQHVTLPITINDGNFMIWHFVSMLPLAFVVGIIYLRTRRLIPIMIVHYVMDVMAILGGFMLSI